jgi:glycosyltransferase involved in cell wall biosynthesis
LTGPGASPLVSALITNWNYGRFLREAIDSALAQTYTPVEVVVVDDGSTDASREILARYGARIHSVLKEHGGQASAFNAGFAAARGEVICFLDSDDAWRPSKVARVVELHREGYGLVCHDLEPLGAGVAPAAPAQLMSAASVRRGHIFDDLLASGCNWPFSATSGLSLTADLARALTPLPEADWPIAADNPIAYGAAWLGPVAVIGELLGAYRIHGANRYMGASRTGEDWIGRIRAVEDPARRLAYVSDLARRHGRAAPRVDLRDRYAYCREWSFITRPWPVLDLFRLWRTGLRQRRATRSPAGSVLTALAWDALASVGISLRLPSPWSELRRRYARRRSAYGGRLPPPLARP